MITLEASLRGHISESIYNVEGNADWALIEGIDRLKAIDELCGETTWKIVKKARKETKCSRDCIIQPGDPYYKYNYASETNKMGYISFHGDDNYCSRCMALILFHRKVWELPVINHTHYDDEKDKAVKSKNDYYSLSLKQRMKELEKRLLFVKEQIKKIIGK